jgi:hypothetical protein
VALVNRILAQYRERFQRHRLVMAMIVPAVRRRLERLKPLAGSLPALILRNGPKDRGEKLAWTLQTGVFGFAVPALWSMSAMPCSIEGVVDRDVG